MLAKVRTDERLVHCRILRCFSITQTAMSFLKVMHSRAALSLAASALVLPLSLGAQTTTINQADIETYYSSSMGGYVIDDGNEYLINSPLSFGTTSSGDNLIVGYDTTGSKLTIYDNEVSNYEASIGYGFDSSGTVEVTAAGGNWVSHGTIYVGRGYGSTGELIVSGYANVTGNAGIVLGYAGESTGNLSMSGRSTTLGTTFITVGYDGTGNMTLGDGATITTSAASTIGSGFTVRGTGTVTLTDTWTKWESSSSINVGSYGTGTLTIENGATVTNTTSTVGNGNISRNGTGTVNVRGSGSSWTNSGSLIVGGYYGTGTVNIESGATVSSVGGKIGEQSNSQGTVTVSGAGSRWTNTSYLYVGDGGSGSLNILDGGKVTSLSANLGRTSASTATVLVSGNGSVWDISNTLTIGSAGTGTLTIENNGLVVAGALSLQTYGSIYLKAGFLLLTGEGSDDKNTLDALLDAGTSIYAWNGSAYELVTSSESALVSCVYYEHVEENDLVRANGYNDYGTLLTSAYAVPEPATYALFGGLGALGLAMYRRRKNASR